MADLIRRVLLDPPIYAALAATKLKIMRSFDDDRYDPLRPADAFITILGFGAWWYASLGGISVACLTRGASAAALASAVALAAYLALAAGIRVTFDAWTRPK